MSNKEVVIDAVRKLPEDATLQEISEEIAILAAIRRGEEAADAGKVIPHDEVKEARYMEFEIVWAEPAVCDLEAIISFIEAHSSTAAAKFRAGILEHVETLVAAS